MKAALLVPIALILSLRVYSQVALPNVIVSSGGSGQSDRAQLSWTVGEPFVGTLSSGSGSLTQGYFYQEISPITSVYAPEPTQEVRVYPNPAVDRLTINLPSRYSGYNLRVLDAVGRERMAETMPRGGEKSLDMSLLRSGIYFLQLRDTANKTVKTVKILILK